MVKKRERLVGTCTTRSGGTETSDSPELGVKLIHHIS